LNDAARFVSTPRSMAFPLLSARDAVNGQLWVTTRDWPALGRLDLASGEWEWFELPPYPHAPTPDGEGGCWTALTRSSAIAHVDNEGVRTVVPVPKTRELLVTVLERGHVWAVDGARRVLVSVDAQTLEVDEFLLPAGFVRPDFVAVDSGHRLWVADTQSTIVATVEPFASSMHAVEVPHPTRALLADADGCMWLGASDRASLTLVGPNGDMRQTIALPGTPFGMDRVPDGRIAVAIKDADLVCFADPTTGSVAGAALPAGSMPMDCTVVDSRCFVTLAASSQIAEIEVPR
jgi:streptogramin lyase